MNAKFMVTGRTKIAGLLGNPVEHSVSPQLHNTISRYMGHDIIYVPLRVEKDELENAVKGLRAINVIGFNVTIPYKSEIIRYLDDVSEEALSIGAVNTVKNENGRLLGYNTDAEGFRRSFAEETGHGFANRKVAIIGAGGAARAIAMKVAADGAGHIDIVNRTISKALELSSFVSKKTGVPVRALSLGDVAEGNVLCRNDIIINTTSLGMYPEIDACPIGDFSCFNKNHVFYDIIYNPPKTKLLKEAEKQGCKAINGLGMLIYQGIYAYEIWTGSKVPDSIKDELFNQLSNVFSQHFY